MAVLLILACGLLPLAAATARESRARFVDSPIGLWLQVSDRTGRPQSLVRVSEHADRTLVGTVVRVLDLTHGPHPLCTPCTGALHDAPVEGLTILWGVRRVDDRWSGGTILDPMTGRTYRVELQLKDGGHRLDVRGYLGTPLLGRTQVWLRQAGPDSE